MKHLLLTTVLFISICNMVSGQNSYNNFFNKYENAKGIESFEISPFFLKFLITKEDDDIKTLLGKINKISFLVSESTTTTIKNDLLKNLPSNIYHDLIEIKNGSSKVLFKIKTMKKKKSEMLMIVLIRIHLWFCV